MIEINNVSLKYGDKTVIRNLSLSIPDKGILGLFGPSGCGKTSLARIIAGLTLPDSGSVTGIAPGRSAFMFQEDRLFPWLTVLENVAAVSDKTRAMELLNKTGLSAEACEYPENLSGGMRRRVSLCRALAYDAGLLILDEPFTGIDDNMKAALYPIIKDYSASRPVILITHSRDEISALADNIFTFPA